jgi:integrase
LEIRLRVHAFPVLGKRQLRDLRPSTIQAWVRGLQGGLSPRTVRLVFATVSSVLSAAVDDGLITHNPCQVRSVRAPAVDAQKVAPWSADRVADVIAALPDRYQALGVVAAGCGLRQGETFRLRVCDVDFLRHRLHVEQQVKLVAGKLLLAQPKGRRTRTVPLPDGVAMGLAEHLRRYPATGEELVFRSREGKSINRTYFNANIWKKALADAGVPGVRQNGMHALRHFYASVLIDAGESVKVVAEYLGHADPGFTLRVYAHLFPSSEDRARQAVDRVLRATAIGALTGADGAPPD